MMEQPVGDPHSTGTLYTQGSYLEQNPDWHVEDSAWKARQVLSMLRRNRLSPRQVCDVGCGAGEVLVELARVLDPGVVFTGYDISPQAIQLAQARAGTNLSFVLGDITTLETPRFDLLLGMDVIEHVEDPFGFLRALKPHADLSVFHIPLDMTAQAVGRNLIIGTCRVPYGHLSYFQKETALATLADAGYEVIDWCYTPSSFARSPQGSRDRLIRSFRRTLFKAAPDLTQRLLGGWSLLALAR
jgi:SAM-dependent methyltransferase